jgi:DNA-binding MarR family transcriptional regulator
MTEALTLLQQLGFTEYEARAYVTLLQRNPLNGYELAKTSGLPRANIYGVLQRLEERGAVVRIDGQNGSRYSPLPPDELTQRLAHQVQHTIERAQQELSALTAPTEEAYLWNLRGYQALVEHVRALVEVAQQQLLVAITPTEARNLEAAFAAAETRGVGLVTLCMAACPNECGNCRGRIYRYRVAPELHSRGLLVVADDAEVVAGQIEGDDVAQAIRTVQPVLVQLVSWYIRHSIALATVLTDLGDRFETLLKPETQAMLKSVELGDRKASWLALMRQLLRIGEEQS